MIVPTETDATDEAVLRELIDDDEAIVNAYMFVLSWVDGDGSQRWRVYTNSDLPVSANVGLLEMAKLNIIARSETGLPLRYEDDD